MRQAFLLATTCALMVFARYPVPGRVKTRLARQVGDDLALGLYAALAVQVWETALATQQAQIAHALLFCDSLEMLHACREWLPGATGYYAQESGDLGQRLGAGFRDLFRAGYTRVIAIGTDCVAFNPSMFRAAFDALDDNDVVLGPATDGGYYLLGLKRYHRTLFEEIPWNTPKVYEATLVRSAQQSLTALTLPVHADVDAAEDAMAVLGTPYADGLPAHLKMLLRRAAMGQNDLTPEALTPSPD